MEIKLRCRPPISEYLLKNTGSSSSAQFTGLECFEMRPTNEIFSETPKVILVSIAHGQSLRKAYLQGMCFLENC